MIDLPISGLRIARRRADADGFAHTCRVAVADGAALPFRDGSFDAVFHSDVLCCLVAKRAVLQACRSVVRAGGHMVFAVILISPRLTAAERRSAAAGAPTFVESETSYPKLLGLTGWNLIGCVDLTAAFLASVRRVRAQEQAHREALQALFGTDETRERLERRRKTVAALERGLLRRELFHAVAQA